MKIFDSHLHYGSPGYLSEKIRNSPLRDKFPSYRTVQFDRMDDYDARLAEHGVEKAVLIPFIYRELNKHEESMLCIERAGKAPDRYYPYALLDEEEPLFAEEYYKEIVGLKEHIVIHETALNHIRKDIFASLQDHGLILLLHTHRENRIEYVSDIVRNFPRLKIQIAHMGRGLPGDIPFMLGVIRSMIPYDNVFFDTSTVRQPEAVTAAASMIGTDRILYGSDFPFYMDRDGTEDIMEAQIQHVMKAGLKDPDLEKIFHGNFERLISFGK